MTKKAKKATEKATKKAKKATEKATKATPQGFGSDEARKRVVQALASLATRFPTMSANDRTAYLCEVGANRYNALAKYRAK